MQITIISFVGVGVGVAICNLIIDEVKFIDDKKADIQHDEMLHKGSEFVCNQND